MIDYYFEFVPGAELYDFRYGFIRGYHPDQVTWDQQMRHGFLWTGSSRIWLENANGAVLVKVGRREVHERINPRELAWIKLQAREIEL